MVGVGGMGTVFLAEDTQVEGLSRPRTVALKVMRPGMSEGSKGRKRFLREVQALVAQDHPAILPVLDVGEDNGVPFFTMPLLRGESLDARLRRDKILPIAETIFIAHEIASGLAAAHERGVIHRDVKPANVFLCRVDDQSRPAAPRPENPESSNSSQEDAPSGISETTAFRSRSDRSTSGSVKLMDFGLARTVDQTSWQTQAGTVLGTPHYMAPQQIEGRDLDSRADLFSLGCVLFRMTTGTLPFTGPSHMSVFVSLTRDTPPNVRHLNPAVPPALAELIEQLLEKQPDRRPRSAAEVAERLTAIGCGDVSDSAVDPATPLVSQEFVKEVPSATTVMIRPARIRKTVLGIVSMLALVIAVVAWKSRPQTNGRRDDLVLAGKSVVAEPARQNHDLEKSSGTESTIPSPAWQMGSNENSLHGLVARPASLKGVKRWQLETALPRGELHDLRWSPNGKSLAVANGRQLRIYEFANVELKLKRILSDGSGIRSLSWSPDSERVVVSYRHEEFPTIRLRVWNVWTGAAEQSASLPEWWEAMTAWSPDGKWMVAVGSPGSNVGKVLLYQMPGLVLDRELASIDKGLCCVSWSPDSSTIVAGSESDPILRMWKLDGTSASHSAVTDGGVTSVSWSPDGNWIAAGVVPGLISNIQLLTSTGEKGPTLSGSYGFVDAITWSPDSQKLAVASNNVLLWNNLEDAKPRDIGCFAPNQRFRCSWHPGGRFVVFGHHVNSPLWIYDVAQEIPRVVSEPQPSVSTAAISRTDGRLAFGASDGSVRAQQQNDSFRVVIQHRLSAGWQRPEPFEKLFWANLSSDVQWTASGRQLVSILHGVDPFMRVWNAEEPSASSRSIPIGDSPGPRLQARGEHIVHHAGGLHERDLTTGEVTQKWTQSMHDFAFAVSTNGEFLVYPDSGKLKVLRLADGETVRELEVAIGVLKLSWTADSRFLVIDGAATYELWNARTWQRIWHAVLPNYGQATIAPDGHAIATITGIADFETGSIRHRFRYWASGFAWYPDSQRFASVTDNVIAVHSVKDASVEHTIVPIAPDHTLVFDAAGNLEQGDLSLLDRECICIIERHDGSRDLIRPSELLKLVGMSAWPTTDSLLKPRRKKLKTDSR